MTDIDKGVIIKIDIYKEVKGEETDQKGDGKMDKEEKTDASFPTKVLSLAF